jgi:hypothetical protein
MKFLAKIHDEVIARVMPLLSDIWPVEVPLWDYDFAFSQTGIVLNI